MKNLSLLLVSVLVSIGLGELVLRAFTDFPISSVSNKVDDPRLGYRLSPLSREVDANGFRNAAGKSEAFKVAAIGDSHTFGNNVNSADAWPSLFERQTGTPTYNYGVGSYGIFVYHALVSEVMAGKAEGVIVALYPGNDFVEGFPYCLPEEVAFDFWGAQIESLELSAPASPEECAQYSKGEDEFDDLGDFFRNNLATVSAVEYLVVNRIKENIARARASSEERRKDRFYFPANVPSIERDRVRKHDKTTDLQRPGIARMFANFGKMARHWQSEARRTGVPVGILIVPSRERSIYALIERQGLLEETDPEFRRLIQSQILLEQNVVSLLQELGIPFEIATDRVVDTFEAAVRDDRAFYPLLDDGHPFEDGYRAYADAAAALWAAMKKQ